MSDDYLAQQGDSDGLCGIYAIANFLQNTASFRSSLVPETRRSPRKRGVEAFWYLLEAAEARGWLKAHYILEGYEDYHLADILRTVVGNLSLSYNVFLLSLYAAVHADGSEAKALRKVVSDMGGSAIVRPENEDHWLLVREVKERTIITSDPGRENKKRILRADGMLSRAGIVIVPSELVAS